jgi:hypothetical protein
MIEPPPTAPAPTQSQIDGIVRSGPTGAIALAGTATAIVMAIYFAFYFLVFLPRGPLQ